jgi:hypothetical protein
MINQQKLHATLYIVENTEHDLFMDILRTRDLQYKQQTHALFTANQ